MDSILDLQKELLTAVPPTGSVINDGASQESVGGKENNAPADSTDPGGQSAQIATLAGHATESPSSAAESAESEGTPIGTESQKISKEAASATTSRPQSRSAVAEAEPAQPGATTTRPQSNNAYSAATSRSQSSSGGTSDDSVSSGSSSSSGLNPLAANFQPSSHSAVPPPPTASHFFELCSIDGKGLGLVAVKLIKRGTPIICESPLLRIDDGSVHLAWGPYCRLSNSKKAAYDALHYFKPEHMNFEQCSRVFLVDNNDRNMDEDDIQELIDEQGQVMGRFACNNFACGKGLGVFETTSRLNHSCVPNVHHSYVPHLQKQTVHAMRDILPGEELCTTYLRGEASYAVRSQRIEMLRRTYGFTCQCPACIDLTGESDGRREVMASIAYGLQIFNQGGPVEQVPYVPTSPAQAMQQAEDLIRLLIDEGLPSIELCKAYRMASTQALNIKDFDRAFEHAFQEKDVEKTCLGSQLDDLVRIGVAADCWIDKIRKAAAAAGVPVKYKSKADMKKKTAKQKSAQKARKQKKKKADKLVQNAAKNEADHAANAVEEAKLAEERAGKVAQEAEKKRKLEYEEAYPELRG